MGVRSRAFVIQVFQMPNDDYTTIYTCPAGRTAIIKELSVQNMSGRALGMGLGLRRGVQTVQLEWTSGVASQSGLRWRGAFHVLQSGDQLLVYQWSTTNAAANVQVAVSGALLIGDPI